MSKMSELDTMYERLGNAHARAVECAGWARCASKMGPTDYALVKPADAIAEAANTLALRIEALREAVGRDADDETELGGDRTELDTGA